MTCMERCKANLVTEKVVFQQFDKVYYKVTRDNFALPLVFVMIPGDWTQSSLKYLLCDHLRNLLHFPLMNKMLLEKVLIMKL